MALSLLDKLLEARRRHPFGQFGTSDDESTDNGALGCTHTCWRFIIFAYKGRWYSHDQITRLSGYPFGGGSRNRGMNVDESKRLIKALGLPYVYKNSLTHNELLRLSRTGPVLFAMRYGSWPNWYKYDGKSVPAPFARPLGKAGRNQFSGFFGSHAGVLMGYIRIPAGTGPFVRNDCYVMEPNHDSPARPQNVPYDVVSSTQLGKAYYDVKAKLGWSVYMAFVPTRAPSFPGGLG